MILTVLSSTLLSPTTLPLSQLSSSYVAWAVEGEVTDESSSSSTSSSVSAVSGKLIRTAPASEGLTASSLLQSDTDFYFKELQDMNYVLKQCDQIIDNRDYESIRGILRQEPLRTLRKTSKALQKVGIYSPTYLLTNRVFEHLPTKTYVCMYVCMHVHHLYACV